MRTMREICQSPIGPDTDTLRIGKAATLTQIGDNTIKWEGWTPHGGSWELGSDKELDNVSNMLRNYGTCK